MSKVDEMIKIYQSTIIDIVKNDNWEDFLKFMSKFYKYNFQNNVLIYGQDRDATAVAQYDIWPKLGRNVKKGSKSILLANKNKEVSYGFDIQNTEVIKNDLVKIWDYNKEYSQAIISSLKKEFLDNNTDTDLRKVMKLSIENICFDILDEIKFKSNESLRAATELLIKNTTYIAEERLNIPHKNSYDFDEIYKSYNYLINLGKLTNIASSQFLSNIEKTMKTIDIERVNKNEQFFSQHRYGNTMGTNGHINGGQTGMGFANTGSRDIPKNSKENTEREFREMGKRQEELSTGEQTGQVNFFSKGNEYRGSSNEYTKDSSGKIRRDGEQNEKGHQESRQLVGDSSGIQQHKNDLPGNNQSGNNLSGGIRNSISVEENKLDSADQELRVNLSSISLENFKIDKAKYIYSFGPKTRFIDNVNAIKLLNTIEKESRVAREEEKETLSKYVGWGGIQDAFDENNSSWDNEYTQLKELLTQDEYTSARASVNNSHYTNPIIIEGIYSALKQFGFESGNILEPAAGIGNFMGLLPEDMNVKFTGVEIDSISARIARILYPNADIKMQGFETTSFKDNSFDAVISNVPFGDYKIYDKAYPKNYLIHDYYFLKSLEKVKHGGVIAFVTSKGTMDKVNNEVRTLIYEKARLLGAIRLPYTAFKNANTEVTTDIMFLQKRTEDMTIGQDDIKWMDVRADENGIDYNEYYLNNPDMLIGKMEMVSSRFGFEASLVPLTDPYSNEDLERDINRAVTLLPKDVLVQGPSIEANNDISIDDNTTEVDNSIKNFTYMIKGNDIFFKENDNLIKQDIKGLPRERIEGLISLRKILRETIDLQLENCSDETLKDIQNKLSLQYDNFIKKYGYINNKANSIVFREDNDYPLLCSLEKKDNDNYIKSDIFFKRTIKSNIVEYNVENSKEALIASLDYKGKVDLKYMSSLSGKSEDELINDLKTSIYVSPDKFIKTSDKYSSYETSEEYLSGNVKEKLVIAQSISERYSEFIENVKALEKVIPEDIKPGDIDVKLGSTWIPSKFIRQFAIENFSPNSYTREKLKVNYYDNIGAGSWKVENFETYGMQATHIWGTGRYTAYQIMESTLNFKTIKVYDTVDDKRVLNSKETLLAQEKQEKMKNAFKEWIFKDPERRTFLSKIYNDKFNNIRLRTYNGSHLKLPGMSPLIKLRKHQLNSVSRIINNGNALVGHVVGAGKTFTLIAAGMELKRLGIAHKSMYAVPNHLVQQWGNDFMTLYPSANILVATKKDFEKQNRRKFVSRIATGDYDAVIIAHSSFEKISISKERQEKMIRKEIDEISEYIKKTKQSDGQSWSIKQMEKTSKSLEEKLKRLLDDTKKDDILNFEQLGIDFLMVDEAHMFKNLYTNTKMSNVAGVNTSNSNRASDMLLKSQYIQEINNGRGVVFATGTPISNSMSEMYTMQRFLQSDTLKKMGLNHFDEWASTFGEVVTALELSPEGTGYRMKSRFSKFHNIPELLSVFGQVADIQTGEMLKLPVPEAKYIDVVSEPSSILKEYIKSLGERADQVRNGAVDPTIDNMLKITNDGRKAALDMRCVFPELSDDLSGITTKSDKIVENVYNVWERTSDIKGTQLIFCDLSTPSKEFNVYDDIKNKLILKGVPVNEIAFIHNANTDKQKEELFDKVRKGKVRVLIGSTQKMGAGTNVQTRLVALHHADVPWKPSDVEQRQGRGIRQGNLNESVEIYRYITKGSFDAYSWQLIENKQKFISQVMTGKALVRSADDIDETSLSYAEVKALASGNPLIKEKMEIDIEINKLKMLKSQYENNKYNLQYDIDTLLPKRISKLHESISQINTDISDLKSSSNDPLVYKNMTYFDTKEGVKQMVEDYKDSLKLDPAVIGSYKGFTLSSSFNHMESNYTLALTKNYTYSFDLSTVPQITLDRMDKVFSDIHGILDYKKEKLQEAENNLELSKTELEKPFEYSERLSEKLKRQFELNNILNADKVDYVKGDILEVAISHEQEALNKIMLIFNKTDEKYEAFEITNNNSINIVSVDIKNDDSNNLKGSSRINLNKKYSINEQNIVKKIGSLKEKDITSVSKYESLFRSKNMIKDFDASKQSKFVNRSMDMEL